MTTSVLIIVTVALLAFALAATSDAQTGWSPREEVIERFENHPQLASLYREQDVPTYELPDALVGVDGRSIDTAEAWRANRPALLELLREQMFGRRPGQPESLTFHTARRIDDALDGKATFRSIEVRSEHQGREHRFELVILTPNARGDGPVPAFVLIDFPRRGRDMTGPDERGRWAPDVIVERGYAAAVIHGEDLAPDDAERFTEGVIRLFEGDAAAGQRAPDAWMTIAAWSWGASRAMDFFEQDEAIDASRVAVVGHSRKGKTSLWAGAEDERFDVVISNDSGCGGAALSRRAYGETVKAINDRFPHWFTEHFKAYNERENELPFDQHQLIALSAPRAVYVASADEDLWADPRGEYLALAHASRVWGLWGHDALDPEAMPGLDAPVTTGVLGYHIRSGGHALTRYDWQRYLDFAAARWGR